MALNLFKHGSELTEPYVALPNSMIISLKAQQSPLPLLI